MTRDVRVLNTVVPLAISCNHFTLLLLIFAVSKGPTGNTILLLRRLMSLPFFHNFLLLLYAAHIKQQHRFCALNTALAQVLNGSARAVHTIVGAPHFLFKLSLTLYLLERDDLSKPSSPSSSSSLNRTKCSITHSQCHQGIPQRKLRAFRQLGAGQRPQAVRRHAFSVSSSSL